MLKAGTRIGPYEVVSLVGAGGMGEVWRARDDRLERDVAIKVLPAAFAEDPERLRLFEREARATAALAHPNILAIFDIGTHEGQPYLVEELLAGESLRERLMNGPLSVSKAVELAAQIASGLAAAHSRGIVHRDVKPENVFLTSGGGVKILDFGLAKLARPASGVGPASEIATATVGSQPGTVLGTVGYAAPEQLRGQPVDHRTDVFAFGCVLYEMLSGKRAFHGETQADTISAILTKDPAPLAMPEREIPPELQGIVARCLEKNPDDRFQSTRDLAFNLTQLMRRSGVGTGPLVSTATEVKPGRRRWLLLAAALAGVAAVAAGGVFFGRRTAEVPKLKATRLTFRRGLVTAARFAQDGKTVVYSATWDGAPTELFSLRLGTPESTPLGYTKADLLAVSPSGELALLRNPLSPTAAWLALARGQTLTLATAPLSGGTPKDLDDAVGFADYSPDGKAMAVARRGENGGIEYPLGSVPTKTAVGALRISRDGRRVAFLKNADIALLEPGGAIKTLVRGNPLSGGGLSFAWSPRGDEIWYVDGHKLQAVTSGGRQRVLYTHLTELVLHDVAPDGRVLAAAAERRSRIFFRGEGDAADRELTWLDWTIAGDLSADGKWIPFFESELGVDYKQVIYLRETNGAPPMKLGEGIWPHLSPDGRFVVAVRYDTKEIVIYPVGPGPTRKIPFGEIGVYAACLLPDGKSILFMGHELEKVGKAPGQGADRMWLTDLDGSKPRPVTPEGVFSRMPRITPDGQYLLAGFHGDLPALYPLAGGEPRPIPGLEDRELIAGFSANSHSAFVFRASERPVPVFRLDLRTGRRALVREIMPADRSGSNIWSGPVVRVSADERSYVYSFHQMLSELYLIEGLR